MREYLLGFLLILLLHSSCFADKFTFAVYGDNEGGYSTFQNVLDSISADRSISFAVSVGDITPRGTKADYERYFGMCAASNIKIYDTIGNHDNGASGEGRKIFQKKYGSTWYYFDKGDARFIILDNSRSDGMGEEQINWAKKALATKKQKLVFMHKPIFDPSGMYPEHVMAPSSEAEKLDDLFIRDKVRYVFSGHIHGYLRAEEHGIVYVVTAGAGAPLYMPYFNGGYHNYVKVTVDGLNITDDVVKLDQ